MAKTINFTFEGTDYTLEYTRASVAALENRGLTSGIFPINLLPLFPPSLQERFSLTIVS